MSLRVVTTSRDLGKRWTGKVRRPMTREQALSRWPRIVAHLICESLGYFTPESAANAIAFLKARKPYACEWYSHVCNQAGKGYFDEDELMRIGRRALLAAIRNRNRHKGRMQEYGNAIALVGVEQRKPGATSSMLASWF